MVKTGQQGLRVPQDHEIYKNHEFHKAKTSTGQSNLGSNFLTDVFTKGLGILDPRRYAYSAREQ